jgi:hypothetical protein
MIASDLMLHSLPFRGLWLPMPALNYPLATRSWAQDERDSIELRFPSGKLIASFPLAFVRDGGDNTWEFVLGWSINSSSQVLIFPAPSRMEKALS